MTEVIIQNTPEDYFDVFNTDLFTFNRRERLNWFGIPDRRNNQIHKDGLHPIETQKDSDE